MNGIDRLYVAWRVLRGQAVRVDVRMFGPGDHELTVVFMGGKLARANQKAVS
jgi:hypothetical protein